MLTLRSSCSLSSAFWIVSRKSRPPSMSCVRCTTWRLYILCLLKASPDRVPRLDELAQKRGRVRAFRQSERHDDKRVLAVGKIDAPKGRLPKAALLAQLLHLLYVKVLCRHAFLLKYLLGDALKPAPAGLKRVAGHPYCRNHLRFCCRVELDYPAKGRRPLHFKAQVACLRLKQVLAVQYACAQASVKDVGLVRLNEQPANSDGHCAQRRNCVLAGDKRRKHLPLDVHPPRQGPEHLGIVL